MQGGVTPIDSILTAVTARLDPVLLYKEGVKSRRILPYTSINVYLIYGQKALKAEAHNGVRTEGKGRSMQRPRKGLKF